MSTDLEKRAEYTVATRTEASDMLKAIMKAVSDPNINVEKMERLLAMHERIVERNAKVAFDAALSRIQAKLKPIQQSGKIYGKDKVTLRSRYAPLEDIDEVVRPLLSEEGFAFSLDAEEMPSGKIKLVGKLSHREGHSESKSMPLPIDKNDYRTAIQDHGSTVSFGRRYLLKMHLNIIEKYEDNDGEGDDVPISAEQVRDLNALIVDTKPDMEVFLEYMGVSKVEEITRKFYSKAMAAMMYRKAHAGRSKK